MKTKLILALLPACLIIAACQSMQSRISQKEDLLAAAGFDVKPANSPRREEELKTLPPGRFVSRAKDDQVEYLYADPVVCNCLYIGDQAAYNKYKDEVFQRQLADQQRLTAEMYQEPPAFWDGWSWGPWGWPGPPWW